MEIAVMTERHLPAADELRRLAGWNQTAEDWHTLFSLEPNGCFVAIEHGQVIGTVTSTTYGPQLAWIGMMLVHPDHRRRGIGTRLMRTVLDHLQSRGIACIRLDATPAGRPVYEKLGFVAEWTLTRHHARSVLGSRESRSTRELAEADWPAVEKLDSSVFGVARTRVLRKLAQGSRSALAWPAGSAVLGYGMLRPGSQSDYLGPLVCACPDPLLSLISTLLHAADGRSVFWDIPDENALATDLAKRFGFSPVRPLTRMRFGLNSVRTNFAAQLAIADPSVG